MRKSYKKAQETLKKSKRRMLPQNQSAGVVRGYSGNTTKGSHSGISALLFLTVFPVLLYATLAQAGNSFIVTAGDDQPLKIVATDKAMGVCSGDAIGSDCVVATAGGEFLAAKILRYDGRGKPSFQILDGMPEEILDGGAYKAAFYGCRGVPQTGNWFKGQAASQKLFTQASSNFCSAQKAFGKSARQAARTAAEERRRQACLSCNR